MNNSKELRSDILDFLRREVIGPDPRPEFMEWNNGDEVLRPQEPPHLRYCAGILFPNKAKVEAQTEIDLEVIENEEENLTDAKDLEESSTEEEQTHSGGDVGIDDNFEPEINRANEFLPSAMGLSALVRLPNKIKISVKTAIYEKKMIPGIGKKNKKGEWQPYHYRKALAIPDLFVDSSELLKEKYVSIKKKLEINTPGQELVIHIYSRPYIGASNEAKDRILTVTLMNQTEMAATRPKDSECFYQCGFSLESDNGELCFLEYPEREEIDLDEEERTLRLLYRHRKTFAIGHGCAPKWEITDKSSVSKIETDVLPTYEMKPVLPRTFEDLNLSMLELSNEKNISLVVNICLKLSEKYKKWIEEQRKIVNSLEFPEIYRKSAEQNLLICEKCNNRIVDGIELLKTNEKVFKAFTFMNYAMLQQQLHYDLTVNNRRRWISKGRNTPPVLDNPYIKPDITKISKGKGIWRPFQLAFILMNLRGIAYKEHETRSLVDLIWFPTGGGKTEAYLGLSAFTIFHRRLVNPKDAGTTVLMRYTLRLLTTQQFQRAASLVCASELIRGNNPKLLGEERISIGLWVGGAVTPNQNKDAVENINKLNREGKPNKFVVLTCPWCGAEMGPVKNGNSYVTKGYRKIKTKVAFGCEDPNCEFTGINQLPLLVVDEEIYANRPTLIVGTVDKFALLPWKSEAKSLFGLGTEKPISPPDLIIQDELHLISGALGSMVGIYESTIDALCEREENGRVYPAKIVASTATIFKASEQVKALFARNVFLFPPQGLKVGDSFFAEEAKIDSKGIEVPGRLYVGVFCSAISSHVLAQIRVMGSLLQSVKSHPEYEPKQIDPYWTLIAYFTSLRELGQAATLIRAEVQSYMTNMRDRLGYKKPEPESKEHDYRRFNKSVLELTSRIPSNEIPETLQMLFNEYSGTKDDKSVDVCLATNMIQVGLDVPRLGLMTVIGQPKTTSEYIQATSRIGRQLSGPGLVVSMYNPAKMRDRSLYEHFRSFHQSIYRWVEPSSITPFAIPVRERALHAQIITLSRYWGDELSPNPPPDAELVKRITNKILQRIKIADPEEVSGAEKMLKSYFEKWARILPDIYGTFGNAHEQTPLMYQSGVEPKKEWIARAKSTPTSMRNVDATCNAYVISQFEDKENMEPED